MSKGLIKIIITSGLIITVGAILAYFTFFKTIKDNAETAFSALEKLVTSESIHLAFALPKVENKPYLTGEAWIIKDTDKYSKYLLSLDAQNKDKDVSKIIFITNNNESYAKPTYSNLESLEKKISSYYPKYKNLSITSTVRDLLTGELWLKLSNVQTNQESILTENDKKELLSLFKKSVIVRAYEKSDADNITIKLGFNRRKLLTAINYLKDTDSGLTIKEINSVKDFVYSSSNWNSDILIIKIYTASQEVREVIINLPSDPKNLIKEVGFSNTMRFGGITGPIFNIVPTQIFDVFEKNDQTGLFNIATISFSERNTISEIPKPEKVLDYNTFAETAQKEVLPILRDYVKNSSESATPKAP